MKNLQTQTTVKCPAVKPVSAHLTSLWGSAQTKSIFILFEIFFSAFSAAERNLENVLYYQNVRIYKWLSTH